MQMQLTAGLASEKVKTQFSKLYGQNGTALAGERIQALYDTHTHRFGKKERVRFFSAPGGTELAGNHTDHNLGKVLAAAVNLDTVMAASKNTTGVITLYSEGFSSHCVVDTRDLGAHDAEKGVDTALVRGVCARMAQLGYTIGGFDAVTTSSVLVGSGLSSSAAFEVLLVTALDCLYGKGEMDGIVKAQIARYAENYYFAKPCGLMDQAASALGGLTALDFKDETPKVHNLTFDFAAKGYSLVVVNTGSAHDDLTDHYAAIPAEMRSVAACYGESALRGVSRSQFLDELRRLRACTSDRALLRALHYFNENERVDAMVAALKRDDLPEYFRLCIDSGESSWKLLQNITAGAKDQPLALALALCETMLKGTGAWRVHGGGFAGTIQAYVPMDTMPRFIKTMNGVFGENACTALAIRPLGAIELVF